MQVSFEDLAAFLEERAAFLPTRKSKRPFSFYDGPLPDQPAMSYTVFSGPGAIRLETVTADGVETANTCSPGDIVVSGPSREQYVMKAEKFARLYVGAVGGTVFPEQSLRDVAKVSREVVRRLISAVASSLEGDRELDAIIFRFMAPWGTEMVLKPGDYLVRERVGVYYRIARTEFLETYEDVKAVC